MKRPTLLAAYTLAEAHGTGGFKGWVELHSGWVTVEVCFDCLSLSTENNIDFWGNTFRKKTFLKFTIIRIVLMINQVDRSVPSRSPVSPPCGMAFILITTEMLTFTSERPLGATRY